MGLLANVGWVELSGYFASVLVFVAFYMKMMIPLRFVAILSNVAFIIYAVGSRLYPVPDSSHDFAASKCYPPASDASTDQ